VKTLIHLVVSGILALGWFSIAASEESNVRPGINERFKSPALEVNEFVEIFESASREVFARRHEIARKLELRPGTAVADIGAGTGFFTEIFAEFVGAEGRVYAVEVSPRFLDHLRQRARKRGFRQIKVVEGDERSARLEEESIDVAFVCDTYHHFEYPQAMLASLHRALRPGGRLIIVDFEKIEGATQSWVLEHVRAGRQEVSAEIERAGFTMDQQMQIDGMTENYVLQFRRP
jgi:ubiquinone/menaquinone biosynthesis C-methylase UbiE